MADGQPRSRASLRSLACPLHLGEQINPTQERNPMPLHPASGVCTPCPVPASYSPLGSSTLALELLGAQPAHLGSTVLGKVLLGYPSGAGSPFPWSWRGTAGGHCQAAAFLPPGRQGSDGDRFLVLLAQQGHSSTPRNCRQPPWVGAVGHSPCFPPPPKLHLPSTIHLFIEIQH